MNEEDGSVRASWSHGGDIWASIASGVLDASKITVNTTPYAYEIDADRSPDAVIVIKQSGKEVLKVTAAQLAQLGAGLEALALDREFKE